jgi:hypothetical protein
VVLTLGSAVVLTSLVLEVLSVVIVAAVMAVLAVSAVVLVTAVLAVSSVALVPAVLAGSVALVVVTGGPALVVGVVVVAVPVPGGVSLVPGGASLSWGLSPTMIEGTQAGRTSVQKVMSAVRAAKGKGLPPRRLVPARLRFRHRARIFAPGAQNRGWAGARERRGAAGEGEPCCRQ